MFIAFILFFQEGKIRAKLGKILKGKEGVRFEDSIATGDGIKIVSQFSHLYSPFLNDINIFLLRRLLCNL